MVRHFGIFQFYSHITSTEIVESFAAMEKMIGQIPGLLDMEHGPYDSDEGLDDGFTHGFIMTFDSIESRDAYLPHPIHEKVKDQVVPKLARVIVFDFEVNGK